MGERSDRGAAVAAHAAMTDARGGEEQSGRRASPILAFDDHPSHSPVLGGAGDGGWRIAKEPYSDIRSDQHRGARVAVESRSVRTA